MSKDIIYREDAIKAINLRARIPHDVASALYASMAINAICSVPSADRQQGEWIKTSNDWIDGYCGERLFPYHCGCCGYKTWDDELTNYCPNCGAKMRGADNEAD